MIRIVGEPTETVVTELTRRRLRRRVFHPDKTIREKHFMRLWSAVTCQRLRNGQVEN